MEFRKAAVNDLPRIKLMYGEIIRRMNENGIRIWDDIYPCEFFSDDIDAGRLYVLTEKDEIISAFALCRTNSGESAVQWSENSKNALYLDRLGVNVNYLRRGIGKLTLDCAVRTAKKSGAEYLRLFAVESNIPATKLYLKYGFKKAGGFYDEDIGEGIILREYGFEIKI